MAQPRDTGPYVWVTWVSKLLARENSCEWGAWFKAQHEGASWDRIPSDFDQVQWLLKHGELLEQTRRYYQRQGYQIPWIPRTPSPCWAPPPHWPAAPTWWPAGKSRQPDGLSVTKH